MQKLWHDGAWAEYLLWQSLDKKKLKRINRLIEEIERNGYNSIGKPEPLKDDLSGFGAFTLTRRIVLFSGFKTGNWK